MHIARDGHSKIAFWLLSLSLILLLCAPARAHWADMAAMELEINQDQAQASLSLPTPFLAQADANHDGRLTPTEINAGLGTISALLQQHIELRVGDTPASLQIAPPAGSLPVLAGQAGQTQLNLSWRWTGAATALSLRYDLFPAEAPLAHCLVSVRKGNVLNSLIFNKQHPQLPLIQPSLGEQIGQFLLLGIEHIATGYDHILFLLALLLASSRLPYLLKIVTCFTLAHSLTLTLAVLNLVTAPSRWIESLIAASILYVVCVEVLWKREETPWYVIFGFGLIHGLGFASILREMALPTNQLVTALLSFNLGIELGQLTIVLLLWSILHLLAKKENWYRQVQTASAVMIVLIAGYWLFERAVLGV